MKAALWIGLVAVVALAAAAFLLLVPRGPSFESMPPNRELAPDTLVYYAEARDLRSAWDRMERSEAWQDLEASTLLDRARETELVKDVLATLDQIAAKARYDVRGRNAFKFVGREVSLGIELSPDG